MPSSGAPLGPRVVEVVLVRIGWASLGAILSAGIAVLIGATGEIAVIVPATGDVVTTLPIAMAVGALLGAAFGPLAYRALARVVAFLWDLFVW